MQQVVTMRAMTMKTSSGRVVQCLEIPESAEIIGCSLDDLFYWMDQQWIGTLECPCCSAVYTLLDEITDIAHLVVLDPVSDFDTLVRNRFEEVRAVADEETQVQAVPHLQPQYPQVEPATLRTHRLQPVEAQTTVRLKPEKVKRAPLMESRTCRLEGRLPANEMPQKKRHWWQRES